MYFKEKEVYISRKKMTASIRVRTVIPCGAKTVIGNKIKKAIL
jgi:hypothetical protein